MFRLAFDRDRPNRPRPTDVWGCSFCGHRNQYGDAPDGVCDNCEHDNTRRAA